jgi:hypothetical protein
MRGADHGPDGGEPARSDEVRAPTVDEGGDVLPQWPAILERQVLDVGAARIGGLHEGEDTEPVALQERLERVVSQVRIHGHRVRERRERGDVGARRRGDVAALGVCDHEQPGFAGVPAHVDKGRPAGRALRLEEGRLWLDRDRMPGHCVDDPATELDEAEPRRHERRVGIEPNTERRALLLYGHGKPVCEVLRLAHRNEDTGASGEPVPGNEEAARRRPLDPRRRCGPSGPSLVSRTTSA